MVKETSKVPGVTSKNNTKMEQGKGHPKNKYKHIKTTLTETRTISSRPIQDYSGKKYWSTQCEKIMKYPNNPMHLKIQMK